MMLKHTYYENSKNNFKSNTFSAREWSAPLTVSPAEIKERLKSFTLEGRIIKQLRVIGLAYNLRRDLIEERAYSYLKKLEEPDFGEKSNYLNIDDSLPYYRFVETDEPLLIEFEDGDVFEIDTPQEPIFSMSMNSIPWRIESSTRSSNVDANILFAPCIGRTIKSVEIETYETDFDPMYHSAFDNTGTKRELVSAVIMRLDNGCGLCIEGRNDFCRVKYLDEYGNVGMLEFKELKSALFNREDLHTDALSKYEADSETFYFGKLGAEHIESPFVTLVPGKKNTCLNIAVSDFTLFGWSITHCQKECFDEYGQYEFTKAQWNDILAEAEKLVSFESFDALFEYVTSIKIYSYKIVGSGRFSVTLNNINCCGADFWKHLDLHKTQLKDMKAWTDLALSDSDLMTVRGF